MNKVTSTRRYGFKYDKNLILMIGNIGTGKSTFVKTYEKEYIVLSRDKIRYGIGNGNYVFIPQLEPAIWDGEITLFEGMVNTGINIIVDEININNVFRSRYINVAEAADYTITGIVMPHLSMDECVRRRMGNNHGDGTKEEWEEVWTRFNNKYEQPTFDEGFDKIFMVEEGQIKQL